MKGRKLLIKILSERSHYHKSQVLWDHPFATKTSKQKNLKLKKKKIRLWKRKRNYQKLAALLVGKIMLFWKLVNKQVSKQSILTKMKTNTIRKLIVMPHLEKMLLWVISLSSRRCLTTRSIIMKSHLSKGITRKRKTLWNVNLLRRRDWSRLKQDLLIIHRNRNLSSLQKTFKEIG